MIYKLFLREIKVMPVIIEADSVEQAESKVKEGGGWYLNDESTHSDLDASEYFESLFEKPAVIADAFKKSKAQ